MEAAGKAVFLSYASQDAEAAKRICDALRAAGVEVWFDQSELAGGDAWDHKIRGQIGTCALFVPVISANTQARREGYFRLEWRMAVERMRQMDDDLPFLLPVVIDDTADAVAFVPDRFRDVQWTRLKGGETPPAFCGRVKEMLAEGPSAHRSTPQSPVPAAREGGHRARTRSSWTYAIVGAGLVAAGLAAWYATRSAPVPAPHGSTSTATPAATAVLSEARRLAEQAKGLIENGDDANRETYATAEELLKRAVALDATDGEVLAVYAQLSTSYIRLGLDPSAARGELARSQAERAVLLAPDSDEAQFALSYYYYRANPPEAEKRLRQELAKRPDDKRLRHTLALALRQLQRRDEAFEIWRQIAQMPGGDAAALAEMARHLISEGRVAQAEAALERSLALRRSGRVLLLKVHLQMQQHGDLDAAQAIVREVPAWAHQEDRGGYLISQLAMWRREPDAALRAIQRVPREYLSDNTFTGPKAALAGQAHQLAGRADAARNEWRTALQLVERMLAQDSQPPLLFWRAWLQAALGDQAAAEESRRLFAQTSMGGWTASRTVLLARIDILLGRKAEVLESLTAFVRRVRSGANMDYVTPAALRLDPTWDLLRGDPAFATLLEAAGGRSGGLATSPDATTALAPDKSIAVLAFANLSDDKANEFFSDGISEELLNVLAKVPGLKVSARTSAFHFKGKNVPIPEIARQLGVAYVVEGSVRKQGEKVRITAQLIKAADGFHVWSDTFTRDLKDIFAVQDEIAGLVAQNLKLGMGLAVARPRPIVNPEAHQLVLEGRHFWNLRTFEGFDRAEAAFTKATELDPQFAQAYAGLADVRWTRAVFESYSGANLRSTAEAVQATERALELDPLLAEAYPAAGAVLQWTGRLAEAEEVFKKAIALNPNYALAHHWYALVLEGQGRLDDALAEIEQAIQLDPLSVSALSTRHRFLLLARRVSEALAADGKVQALRPDFFFGTGLHVQGLLAAGRRDEALAAARAVVAHPSLELRWISDASAVFVLRTLGRQDEAVAHVDKLLPRLPADSYLRGLALAALDRWNEAMPYLERTPPGLHSIYFWNPIWDRWREDPSFLRLMEKLGCMAEYKVARATLQRMQPESEARK